MGAIVAVSGKVISGTKSASLAAEDHDSGVGVVVGLPKGVQGLSD